MKNGFPSHPLRISRFRAGMRINVTKICLLFSLAVIPVLCPAKGFAAITAADLTRGGSNLAATSYTTASITPSSNNLVLAWVTNSKTTTAPDNTTLSGNGLTWVRVATVTWGTSTSVSPRRRTTLFRAMGAAPTSGTVTIAFGGASQTGCLWSIQQFAGVSTSGTDGSGAVVQSVTNWADNVSTGGLSITLAALSSSMNATVGGFSNRINSSTSLLAGAGYTAFTGAAVTTPTMSLRAEWNAAGTTTVDMTQSAISDIAGIAVEIVADICPGNTVRTTADTGVGSLRECINKANANAGTTIGFNIPGPGNQSSGGNSWWKISPTSVLPAITANGTVIDGTTQTTNVGNTSAVVLGSGGTVGVDGLALNQVAGPEVEIRGSGSLANGIQIRANNVTIRGLAINGFGTAAPQAGIRIDDTFTGTLIENNVLGSTATSFSDPGAGARNWIGIDSEGGDSGTIRNNLIGFSQLAGIALNIASSNWTVGGNEIRDSGLATSDGDGITINASPTNTVTGNLITGSSSQGIVVTGAGATGNVFTNNTVTGNGVGIPSGLVQSTGITMRSGAASTVLDRNVVNANYGAGVQVNNGATGTRMTRNSFFANGTITARTGGLPTGQIGIDLNSPTDDINLGTPPFVTLNDFGDADTGGNDLLNFPILSTATVAGGNLTLTGFATPGSTIELFLAESPPDPRGFGEGRTYLTALVEGSAADLDNTTGTYGPAAINGIAQGTNTTNRFRFVIPLPGGAAIGSLLTSTATIGGATSEFSGNVTITESVYTVSGTAFEDVNYGGGAGRDRGSSSGVVRSGARVELYNNAGAYVTAVATDLSGNYSFPGLVAGSYTVRVVDNTVTSSRGGSGLLPVLTYRTNAGSGTAVGVTNYVGGQNPAVADAPNGAVGAVMNTTTGVFTAGISGTAQSFSPITISTGDVSGVDFGLNFDTIVNTNDAGRGSLRQFITNANALGNGGLAQAGRTAGIESAIFMISNGSAAPGLRASLNYFSGGVATISVATWLPHVTDPIVLDGRTQPGFSNVPIIELNGSATVYNAVEAGLVISAGNSVVRGLVINRFATDGVRLETAGGNTVEGNYLGTDATGMLDRGNGYDGIFIANSSGNHIGGLTAGDGNIISGNKDEGIDIASSSSNLIEGNLIGLAADQVTALGNTSNGVQVRAGAVTGNRFRANRIANNGRLGIDLLDNGVTANDGLKSAGQPNLLMDFPFFTSAVISGTTLTVGGYVGSAPNQSVFAGATVEVFKSDNDPSGYGEGGMYLGTLTADANGNFSGAMTVSGVAVGDRITGTATDGSNNTSEFGANVTVAARAYQPDAMIKLSTEGAGAYATDNVYETTATTQVKSQGVVSASTAIYNVLFQNDGNVSDNVVITQGAVDNCAGFTIQYLDNTSTDRTAAVTGAGYAITGMAAGSGTTWTLRVTPAGTVAGGSPACRVSVTATSTGNGTRVDQVRAITSSTSASLTLLKSADRATVAPGQDITYTVNASNGASLTPASAVVVTDPIPTYAGFRVGSATFSPGTSTLSGTPVYSSNNGATWTYSPVSGGCAAPAGYDFCVTNVRWTTTGTMPAGTSFTVNFVVRVK